MSKFPKPSTTASHNRIVVLGREPPTTTMLIYVVEWRKGHDPNHYDVILKGQIRSKTARLSREVAHTTQIVLVRKRFIAPRRSVKFAFNNYKITFTN